MSASDDLTSDIGLSNAKGMCKIRMFLKEYSYLCSMVEFQVTLPSKVELPVHVRGRPFEELVRR